MASSLVSRRSASRLRRSNHGRVPSSRPHSSTDPRTPPRSRLMAQLRRPLKVVISLAVFVLLSWSAYLAFFTTHLQTLLPSQNSEILTHADLETLKIHLHNEKTDTSRRLRLFMPADSPHINLCKTIMSGVALGYPMPTLLNWNREYNHPEWHFAGSHIAKLESLLAGIEALLEDTSRSSDVSEDDLAVMMDAYDIWFQLPPSVLIQRYHQLNREADERIRKGWRTQVQETQFPIPPPRQDILVTTGKHCFPDSNSGSHPHYEHWPESPMPSDMYGEGTDQVPFSFDPARKYRKVRPRCVNTGMIMGTMGAMRDALRRCKEKVEAVIRSGRQIWSDQALFAEVIGDQEMWRKWVKHLESSWDGGVSHNDLASLAPEIRKTALAALQGERFDFGIGLDYSFATMPPTCSAEEDGAFVRIDNASAVLAESLRAGVPGPARLVAIPPELEADNDTALGVQWGDAPLYSDLFFGNTPVAIHHNAYVDGLKPWRLKHWWDRMWFHSQLRDLVTRRLTGRDDEDAPLARIQGDGGDEIVYRAPRQDGESKQVRVFEPAREQGQGHKWTPITWDGVCQKGNTKKWYDELFGDGNGPLDI